MAAAMSAYTFGGGLAALYALWLFYLAVMNLKRAKIAGRLSRPALALGLPVLAVALAVDVMVNLMLVSLLMLERPREWTVSERLTRHLHSGSGWRRAAATWVCSNLLDAFDPSGSHCGCGE